MNLPATALHPNGHLLNVILLRQASEAGSLVTIDLAARKVTAAAEMCSQYDKCAWNMGWAGAANATVTAAAAGGGAGGSPGDGGAAPSA